jgi:hypothetical protein
MGEALKKEATAEAVFAVETSEVSVMFSNERTPQNRGKRVRGGSEVVQYTMTIERGGTERDVDYR